MSDACDPDLFAEAVVLSAMDIQWQIWLTGTYLNRISLLEVKLLDAAVSTIIQFHRLFEDEFGRIYSKHFSTNMSMSEFLNTLISCFSILSKSLGNQYFPVVISCSFVWGIIRKLALENDCSHYATRTWKLLAKCIPVHLPSFCSETFWGAYGFARYCNLMNMMVSFSRQMKLRGSKRKVGKCSTDPKSSSSEESSESKMPKSVKDDIRNVAFSDEYEENASDMTEYYKTGSEKPIYMTTEEIPTDVTESFQAKIPKDKPIDIEKIATDVTEAFQAIIPKDKLIDPVTSERVKMYEKSCSFSNFCFEKLECPSESDQSTDIEKDDNSNASDLSVGSLAQLEAIKRMKRELNHFYCKMPIFKSEAEDGQWEVPPWNAAFLIKPGTPLSKILVPNPFCLERLHKSFETCENVDDMASAGPVSPAWQSLKHDLFRSADESEARVKSSKGKKAIDLLSSGGSGQCKALAWDSLISPKPEIGGEAEKATKLPCSDEGRQVKAPFQETATANLTASAEAGPSNRCSECQIPVSRFLRNWKLNFCRDKDLSKLSDKLTEEES